MMLEISNKIVNTMYPGISATAGRLGWDLFVVDYREVIIAKRKENLTTRYFHYRFLEEQYNSNQDDPVWGMIEVFENAVE